MLECLLPLKPETDILLNEMAKFLVHVVAMSGFRIKHYYVTYKRVAKGGGPVLSPPAPPPPGGRVQGTTKQILYFSRNKF